MVESVRLIEYIKEFESFMDRSKKMKFNVLYTAVIPLRNLYSTFRELF